MQSRFTSKAQEALNYAADTAAMLGHGYIGSEHLLIGLIKAEGIRRLRKNLGIEAFRYWQ